MSLFTDNSEWLKTLAPGDKAAVIGRGFGSDQRIYIWTIKRLTATQIVATRSEREKRFRRDYGNEVGSPYGDRLEPITPEILATLKRQRLLSKLYKTSFKDFSTEFLELCVKQIEDTKSTDEEDQP